MTLGELTQDEFRARLRDGLPLRTGPFHLSLRSNLNVIAESVHLLYADFPVIERQPFYDFHVRVSAVRRVDLWLRPLSRFQIDGYEPFRMFPVPTAAASLEWGINRGISTRSHHLLVIHAAVLEKSGRAVILLGESGSGKSTLCAAMALSGWRLLSDELALISPADGSLAALARPIILKNESIRIIRDFAAGVCMGREMPGTSKGTVAHMRPPADSVARAHESARPGLFVFVNYQAGAPAQLEPVPKPQAHMRIARNAFNYGILGRVGFETLADAVDAAPAYVLTYGQLTEAIPLLGQAAAAQ
ncbi:MAG: HprK-related kinase A [Planctomycetaceae bacterium]|nr:HprK-related kinase A [Planctomycetaceae bacterium]